MEEHDSFTSLMAMVESHLSKTSVSASPSDGGGAPSAAPSFSLPNICSVRNSASERFVLPPPRTVLQLPRFQVKDSEVTEILANQMKNMLVARENDELDRRRRADSASDARDEYMIDLSAAIIRPGEARPSERATPSSASSVESLVSVDEPVAAAAPAEALPLCADLSHMLRARVRRGACSAFGRVLAARLRARAAPYLHEAGEHPKLSPFDFSCPSPCDVNRARRLHPQADLYAHMNMVERFMATTRDQPEP